MKLNKNVIKKIFVGFLIINIFIFAIPLLKQTIGRPNCTGKLFMVSAQVLNIVYAMPLAKILGKDNILVKPIFDLRDFLFNQGYKFLPENDAERAMWWYGIKFKSYENIDFNDYIKNKSHSLNEETKMLYILNNSYENLEELSTKKIKDKFFNKNRFWIQGYIASKYLLFEGYTLSNYYRKENKLDKIKYPEQYYLYYLPNEIKKIEQIRKWTNDLRTYYKKNNKEGYKKLYNPEKIINTYVLDNEIHTIILTSKIVNKKFNCNDENVNVYLYTYKKIMENDNKLNKIFPNFYQQKYLKEYINSHCDK
ncbi:MAG: hypothetical protein PHV68_07535 [Candidatus Gastranaerophilales bacterium]|nr:hypothetical protein [Candidatus Gastranaerophilales bacterium]